MAVNFGKRVHEALNKQICDDFEIAYLYISMSSILKNMGLGGCARWVTNQSQKKYKRALKIFEHMQDRNSKVKLNPIAAPKQEWRAPLHIFEEMQRREQRISASLDAIYEITQAEKDYQSQCFLAWFINEQTEVEAMVTNLQDRLRKMQTTDLGVILFDMELSQKE
ncbi:MAG: ferritin [Holosporaceae bacterium]|jgi:ferritin|nr:ferritin [Holosporaceae bacterium]